IENLFEPFSGHCWALQTCHYLTRTLSDKDKIGIPRTHPHSLGAHRVPNWSRHPTGKRSEGPCNSGRCKMLYLKAEGGNLGPGDTSKPALTARFVPFRLHCLNSMCIPEFPLSTSGPTEKIHLTEAVRSLQSSPHVSFCSTSREGYEVHTRRFIPVHTPSKVAKSGQAT